MTEDISIIVVTQTTNFISLIGNLFVIIHFIRYHSVHLFAAKLLFCVSFSNLFVNIGTLFSINQILTPSALCTLQAVFIQFGDIAGLQWITVISYVLYKLTYEINFDFIHLVIQYFKYIHLVIWSVSLVLTIFPLFFVNMYGPSGGICWINDASTAHIFMRIFIYYLWWILSSVFTIYAAIKVTKYVFDSQLLKASLELETKNNAKIILKTIWYYPLIIIGFTLMYIVWRLLEVSTNNKVPSVLIGFAIGIGNLFGFVNFIVYVTNKKVSENIKANCYCYEEQKIVTNNCQQIASNEEIESIVTTD
eukprot:415841_1